jgi:hypothetical protein
MYFALTGYFEVEDLRTVTLQFTATNARYVSMVVGEWRGGTYTEVDQGVAYDNDFTAHLVNRTLRTRFPVRIEYSPNHDAGQFFFSIMVDGEVAYGPGDLKYFYYT